MAHAQRCLAGALLAFAAAVLAGLVGVLADRAGPGGAAAANRTGSPGA